jgi:Flp pilus assembly protein TadB
MSIVGAVFKELLGMFLGDAELATSTLSVVAVTAVLVRVLRIQPLFAGSVLVIGCLTVLVWTVCRAADKRDSR